MIGVDETAATRRLIEADHSRRVTSRGLYRAFFVITAVTTLVVASALSVEFVRWNVQQGVIGFDFEGTLWEPGRAILDGRSPYPRPLESEVDVGNPSLYPPLLLVLVAPLAVLPWELAVTLWSLLLVSCVAGGLRALGVRDVRCYLAAALALPVLNGLLYGNATLLLVPLVALAWRWRESWARAGTVVGLAVASKLLLWPLVFWLLGTRRYRAAVASMAVGAVATFGSWAIIGFDGLTGYPELLRVAESVFGSHSYSLVTIAAGLGLGDSVAAGAVFVLGVVLALVAFACGRQRLDATAISLAILAAILGSPIVWPYYYALLLVPLAIVRSRFAGLWLGFSLFWIMLLLPAQRPDGGVPCCRPDEMPAPVWDLGHSPPQLFHAAALALAGAAIATRVLIPSRQAEIRLP